MFRGIVEAVAALLAAAERRPELTGQDQPLRALVELLSDAYLSSPDFVDAADDDLWADLSLVWDLTNSETRILALAFAASTDVNVASACSLLQGSSATEPIAVAVAAELAGIDPRGPDRAVLSPNGTLVTAGLLEVNDHALLLARRLWMPEPVVAHLTRQDGVADNFDGARFFDPLPVNFSITDRVVNLVEAATPVIYIHDDARGSGVNLAAGALERAELPYLAVTVESKLTAKTARDVVRRAALTRQVLILRWDPAQEDAAAGPGGDVAAAVRVLSRARVPVLWVSGSAYSPTWLPWLPPVVAAEPFAQAGRETLWTRELPELSDRTDWPPFPFSPDEVVRAADSARSEAASRGDVVTMTDVRRSTDVAAATFRPLSGTRRITPSVRLADLTLAPRTRDRLEDILSWTRHRQSVLDQHPSMSTGGRLQGVAALFTGPSGTGKTMAAQAVAGELGYELLTVDLSAVIDKYIGETEKKLEKIFAAAESINSVLFFDEADALFGTRSQVTDARDKYANQETAWLLQRMETFGGLAVLATNLRANLDRAFTRRLNFVVAFDPPGPELRLILWRRFLSSVSEWDREDSADLSLLAAHADVTAGDIRNIVLAALHSAERHAEPLGMKHLLQATAREFDKLGRRLPAPLDAQEVVR